MIPKIVGEEKSKYFNKNKEKKNLILQKKKFEEKFLTLLELIITTFGVFLFYCLF
jgi:hypothetical protein